MGVQNFVRGVPCSRISFCCVLFAEGSRGCAMLTQDFLQCILRMGLKVDECTVLEDDVS